MVNLSDKTQFISVVDEEADIAYLFRDTLSIIKGIDVFAFTDRLGVRTFPDQS